MNRTITVEARQGAPYTVSRNGRMFGIARATKDGRFVHRIVMSKRDAYRIADALVDLAEDSAAT